VKTERFEFKLSPEDKALIVQQAHMSGKSVGSYVLDIVVPVARKAAKK
jgi:uncharacterized protein (DUF1778 family)